MRLILPVNFFQVYRSVVSESWGVAMYAAHTQTCMNLRAVARSSDLDLSLMPDWAILDFYRHRCDENDAVFLDLLGSL